MALITCKNIFHFFCLRIVLGIFILCTPIYTLEYLFVISCNKSLDNFDWNFVKCDFGGNIFWDIEWSNHIMYTISLNLSSFWCVYIIWVKIFHLLKDVITGVWIFYTPTFSFKNIFCYLMNIKGKYACFLYNSRVFYKVQKFTYLFFWRQVLTLLLWLALNLW